MLRILPFVFLCAVSAPGFIFAAEPTLEQKIDAAIAKVHAVELTAAGDTPWVIMHAAIAYEKDLTVTMPDGRKMNALAFLLNEAKDGEGSLYRIGGNDAGFVGEGLTGQPGVPRIRTRDTTPGFKASFILQDHVDQFLFAYADAGVPLDAPGTAEGKAFTVQTLVDASLSEFKPTQELGWTLVVTSHYLPIDAAWKTAAGADMSTADIVALAVKRDVNRETEGGAHHLYGVAYALNAYRTAHPDAALAGPWADARAYLDKFIKLAREYQNDDGSFSQGMFRGQQIAKTPAHLVWSTGHTIEWLCLALPPEELKADWMKRAVGRLADELNRVDLAILSKGGLYHAAHALRLYREKTAT